MTNEIREQWEAKKAERANRPDVLPALPTQFTTQQLDKFFNYRARPDQASWWEFCQDKGYSYEKAIAPLYEAAMRYPERYSSFGQNAVDEGQHKNNRRNYPEMPTV